MNKVFIGCTPILIGVGIIAIRNGFAGGICIGIGICIFLVPEF